MRNLQIFNNQHSVKVTGYVAAVVSLDTNPIRRILAGDTWRGGDLMLPPHPICAKHVQCPGRGSTLRF
jgi:hypothetical protein